VSDLLHRITGLPPTIQSKLVASLVVVVLLWITSRITYRILQRYYHEDIRSHYQARKMTSYTLTGLTLLLIGWIWFEGLASLATLLGLASAGLMIALKDLLIDLAGWIFIILRKPFTVGDRIQIGTFAGDVIDIRPFQFTILEIGNWVSADQSTGRIIHIPNGKVFSEAQASYTQGFEFIWDEIPVTITFESNWQKAKNLLLEIARKHAGHHSIAAQKSVHKASKRYFIFYSKLTPIVYTSVVSSGVQLTIRYLSEPRRRRGNEQAIWEDILRTFAACPDIAFAYPTRRFYYSEGGAASPPSSPVPPTSMEHMEHMDNRS